MRIENISPKVSMRPVQSSPQHEEAIQRRDAGILEKPADGFKTGNLSIDGTTEAGKIGLAQAIEKANEMVAECNRRFDFSVHEETQTIMVKVIDTENGEVIREIPPEKILDLVAKLWELAGIIVDERV